MSTGDRAATLCTLLLATSFVSSASAQAGAASIDLDRLGNPVRLEQTLRDLLNRSSDRSVAVTNGTAHRGDLRVASGETIRGNLLVLEGNADLQGRVTGNLVVLDGDLVLHEGGRVEGDAVVLGGRVRERGGAIEGEQRVLDRAADATAARPGVFAGILTRTAGLAGVLLTLGLLGFGIVLIAQPQLETISDTVSHSMLRSLFAGLLAQVLVLPTLGLLLTGLVLSVVGILLVPFVLIAVCLVVVAALLSGFLAVVHAIGERRLRRRMAAGERVGSANSYRYVLLGLSSFAVLWAGWILFGWVPLAGALVFAAAALATWLLVTVGFGAALLSRGGIRPAFAGDRYLPQETMTDEYLWATPRFGVDAVKRPPRK